MCIYIYIYIYIYIHNFNILSPQNIPKFEIFTRIKFCGFGKLTVFQ